jgi:hypothetical protein
MLLKRRFESKVFSRVSAGNFDPETSVSRILNDLRRLGKTFFCWKL